MPDKIPEKALGKAPRFTISTNYTDKGISKSVNKNIRATRYSKAFSLIELMVAMSLFAFSLLAVMSLQVKALGLLSDANLKSQAIILASSHQELQKLSSKDIEDLDLLISAWQTRAHKRIPEVNIKKSTASEKGISIRLSWPSSHKKSNCGGSSQSTFDCFHL